MYYFFFLIPFLGISAYLISGFLKFFGIISDLSGGNGNKKDQNKEYKFNENTFDLEKIFEIIFTKKRIQDINEDEAINFFKYTGKNNSEKRTEFITEILIEIQDHLKSKEELNGLASRETYIILQSLLDNTAIEYFESECKTPTEAKLMQNFISDFESRYPFMKDLFQKHKNNSYQNHLNSKITKNHPLSKNYYSNNSVYETNKITQKQKIIDTIKRIRELYNKIKTYSNKKLETNRIANVLLLELQEIDNRKNIEEIKKEIIELKSIVEGYLKKNKLVAMIKFSQNFENIEKKINQTAMNKYKSLKGIRKIGFLENMQFIKPLNSL